MQPGLQLEKQTKLTEHPVTFLKIHNPSNFWIHSILPVAPSLILFFSSCFISLEFVFWVVGFPHFTNAFIFKSYFQNDVWSLPFDLCKKASITNFYQQFYPTACLVWGIILDKCYQQYLIVSLWSFSSPPYTL